MLIELHISIGLLSETFSFYSRWRLPGRRGAVEVFGSSSDPSFQSLGLFDVFQSYK